MHFIELLNVTGRDQAGLTAMLTESLAKADVVILDMGQAVIHDFLTLGLLVRCASDRVAILDDLAASIMARGLSVSRTRVSDQDYEAWVTRQGQSRTILTVLARSISASQLAAISKLVAFEGLNIDHINRLSGRIPLLDVGQQTRACLEFSLRGTPSDMFREKLMACVSELDLDAAVQEDGIYRRHRRLIAFDMDSTLINTEVIDELAKVAGVGDQVQAITESAMSGHIDFTESLRRRVSLLRGLDAHCMEDIARALPLTEGAERLFTTLKKLGYKTAIISGGFTFFGAYLKSILGVDYVIANELEMVDGRLTGRVLGTVVDAQVKAEKLKEIAIKENISLAQTIAVGDGANDLDMLATAGLGIAYHAKAIVRQNSRHAISTLGLDSILYLLGISDRDQGMDSVQS
jgi:phosphoserine phosphatase